MSDRSRTSGPSRRGFLKGAAASFGAASLSLQACGEGTGSDDGPAAQPAGSEVDGPLFTGAERHALAELAELVLPGARAWGAVDYIERTLTLFDHDPPRLYAGMVGSTGEWLPFDRVRERAWRLRIYGSHEVPYENEAVLGSVPGHRPVILEGARAAADALAQGSTPGSAWDRLGGRFRDVFTELVLEGSLGDPIYGGNRDGAAWRIFHLERPLFGYGGRPARPHPHGSHRDEGSGGADPLRLTTRVALWILGFFSRRIA